MLEIPLILATGGEIALIALVVGGAVTAVSQVREGREARAQGAARAAIAERNALLAERQALAERDAAAAEAKAQTREGEELLARQRVLFAKAGVEISKGTPLSVVVDQAIIEEQERLTILREGAISAAQATGQADILRLKGKAAKAKGRAASRAATLQAGGTILSTIGDVGLAKTGRFPSRKRI